MTGSESIPPIYDQDWDWKKQETALPPLPERARAEFYRQMKTKEAETAVDRAWEKYIP